MARHARFDDSSFSAEEDALAALKTTLRETVARVDAAIDKLSADQRHLDDERRELDEMKRIVQENMEEVSKIREEYEQKANAKKGGCMCCAPTNTTADEIDVSQP